MGILSVCNVISRHSHAILRAGVACGEMRKGDKEMAVKLGHASGTEYGTARDGAAGDQTGGEVGVRNWYSKPWQIVLRPKTKELADKSAKACEAGCANNNIGYDQNQRNTAHTQAQKVGYDLAKITTPCETDCSAFMTLCALAAGVKSLEYTGNAPTTSTMQSAFLKTGQYELLTDAQYLLSDDYLKRGDILVTPGKHTAMVLSNGSKAGKEDLPKETKKVNYAGQTTGQLNVRAGIGASSKLRFTLPKGMVVAICEECDGWGRLADIEGWVSLAHIKKA